MSSKKYLLTFSMAWLMVFGSLAQVGISNTEFLPDEAAMMDIRAGDTDYPKGLLIPRLDAAMEENLLTRIQNEHSETTDGLMYYSLSKKKYMYYNVALNQVFEINPWTISTDQSSVYLMDNVGIGTDTPDPLYKLDIQNGNVHVAKTLDVSEDVNIDQELHVEGESDLNGNVHLGTTNNSTRVYGNLYADEGVEIEDGKEYGFKNSRTRVVNYLPADFVFFRYDDLPEESIVLSSTSVKNETGVVANNSTKYLFGNTSIKLPEGATITKISARFDIDPSTNSSGNVVIFDNWTNMLIQGTSNSTSGSGSQTISTNVNVKIDNFSKLYAIRLLIPNNSSLFWIQIQYEVNHAD